jgi:hypothetical protein
VSWLHPLRLLPRVAIISLRRHSRYGDTRLVVTPELPLPQLLYGRDSSGVKTKPVRPQEGNRSSSHRNESKQELWEFPSKNEGSASQKVIPNHENCQCSTWVSDAPTFERRQSPGIALPAATPSFPPRPLIPPLATRFRSRTGRRRSRHSRSYACATRGEGAG